MSLPLSNNIAQTGYRTLFVLQLLIRGPVSKSQILEKIAQNPHLKNVASDTIRLDINTLKSLGFDIKIGNKSNKYCYELKLNPIKISILKNELKSITLAKKAMFNFLDFRYIISLHKTFEKIVKLVEPQEAVDEILDFGNFLKIDFRLVKELDIHAKRKNEITIVYNSPSNPNRQMLVKCLDLKYSKKNDKLYLWCECSEYEGIIYLRADKIKQIIRINKICNETDLEPKSCVYKFSRKKKSPFEFEDYEKVLLVTPEFVLVRANYLNEFNFLQRLLSFGDDLIFVEDEEIRAKLIKLITEVRDLYNEKD